MIMIPIVVQTTIISTIDTPEDNTHHELDSWWRFLFLAGEMVLRGARPEDGDGKTAHGFLR